MKSDHTECAEVITPEPDFALKGPEIAPRCQSLDLEVGIRDARIHQFAAVRGDLATALVQLDVFADAVAFLLGHNLFAFDAAHLAAAKPDLRLLKLPMGSGLAMTHLHRYKT